MSPTNPEGDSHNSPQSRIAEFEGKLDITRAFLEREGLDGVVLGTQRNFAWITCGGLNHVGISTQDGVAWIFVPRTGRAAVLAPNNEAGRIKDEEVNGLPLDVHSIAWPELRTDGDRLRPVLRTLADPNRIGVDSTSLALAGAANVESRFAPLRYSLTDCEIGRYRVHARAVARAVEETARAVQPGISEREIEAMLAREVIRAGARPTVLLIAADDRFSKYRHPLPTENRVNSFAALSTCSRRWGLTAAVTRLVCFGSPSVDLTARYRALQNIEARLLAATRPGRAAGAIFQHLQTWYADFGFEDEWMHHHQGGATGYLEREWVATPGGKQFVQPKQAFAWNPTIRGTKIEDTMIAGESGCELLTVTGEWPSDDIDVGEFSLSRPSMLIR